MNYAYKGEAALVFDANKKRLRLEGRLVLDRLMNEVLREMTEEFNEALLRGEVLALVGSAETQDYFTQSARAALGSGS